MSPRGQIRIGVGGWTFEPWRGVFFPDDLKQKDELAYASRKLTSIEIHTWRGFAGRRLERRGQLSIGRRDARP